MKYLFKNFKPYIGSILLILLILIFQAFCDLSLPNYTSDLIDVGISSSGIEYITPEKISEEKYEEVKFYMLDDELELWESSYEKDGDLYVLKDDAKEKIAELDETFDAPIAITYLISQMDAEKLEEYVGDSSLELDQSEFSLTDEQTAEIMASIPQEDMMAMATMTEAEQAEFMQNYMTNYMKDHATELFADQIREGIIEMRGDIEEQLQSLGDSMIHSFGIAFTQAEYEAIGIDTDTIEINYLKRTGAVMLLMAAGMMGASILSGFIASRASAGIGRDLRGKIFRKVLSFTDGEMTNFSTASLITRSTNDIQQVQLAAVMLLRIVIYAPILAVGGIIMVIKTGAGMTWIIVLAVVSMFIIIGILLIFAMPKFKKMQKLVDGVNLISREILTGLLVIRAFSRERNAEERFEEENQKLTKVMLFVNRIMSGMLPLMMTVMYAVSILIVWVSAGKINDGQLEVGSMTAFITYSMLIVMSFLMLAVLAIIVPRAGVAAQRIQEVLDKDVAIKDKKDAKILDKNGMTGKVKFDNVSFMYPDADTNVIENIDFEALPGQTTAFIGSTGSGKSTVVNLIPRFYDVTEGAITIDGVDIREYTQESLRAAIGYVPQKGVLFSGDIKSNILYGAPEGSEEDMLEAARISQSTEFIDEKPDKYETAVAQGGTNVSGGQRQRLSIARAIARNPKIYIFDDSFSALDFKTDVALRTALGPKVKESTVLIVAQRISTILYADQIIVLDEGKMVGKGTHKELMKTCEVYKQIASSQLSEKELSESLA